MRKLAAALVVLAVASSGPAPPAAVGAPDAVATFTIDLEGVRPQRVRADLLSLFIRENQNTLQINLILTNRRVSVGRSKPRLYYLHNLRVRPGDTLRIEPDGRVPDFEARIQSVEARFPANKPPQLLIQAFGEPIEVSRAAKPYRISAEGFNGRRTLVEEDGEQQEDLVTCFGETPGDLRIRFGSRIEVEGVGRGFSTTYVVDDIRHTYSPNNGLESRYAGTHERARSGG